MSSEPEITISNEFASVKIRRVETTAGSRLEIEAPKRGTSIRLDAVTLESISWQEPRTFSEFLEDPTGPE